MHIYRDPRNIVRAQVRTDPNSYWMNINPILTKGQHKTRFNKHIPIKLTTLPQRTKPQNPREEKQGKREAKTVVDIDPFES